LDSRNACVGHSDVETAEFRDDPLDSGLHIAFIGDVAPHRVAAFQRGSRRLDAFGVDIGQDYR
jgi:hypothetical protein